MATSIVRLPRGQVTVNGTAIPFESFEVIQNGHHQPGSFQVTAPLFNPYSSLDWTWWAEETDIEVEILVGFSQPDGTVGSWTSLIVGPVDAVAMAPLSYGAHANSATRARAAVGSGGMIHPEGGPSHPAGAVLTIRGRDYAGQLQDSQVSQQFSGNNLTSSTLIPELVSRIPQLSVDMSLAAAATNAGDDYNDQGGRLVFNRSVWDVMTALADHDGNKVRVQGRSVKVSAAIVSDVSNPYQIFYTPQTDGTPPQPVGSNCITLRMARALNVAKGVDVFVQSYDSSTGQRPTRKKSSVRSTQRAARAAGPTTGNTGTGTQLAEVPHYDLSAPGTGDQTQTPLTYTLNRPGMTPDQAQQHANARAAQIANFEREIEFQIPGDTALTIDRSIALSGTGTQFDQTYMPDQISHRLDVRTGYLMEVRARSKSDDVSITDSDASGAAAANLAQAA